MLKEIVNFIKGARESKESVKRVWLAVFTALAMAVLVSFWLLTLNLPVIQTPGETNPPPPQKPSSFTVFTHGLGIIAEGAKTAASGYLAQIWETRFLTIIAPRQNFILEKLEPLPLNELP